MTERTYYEILGLTRNADGTAVNRTYWLLARKYQAEAVNDPRAHELLDELNEAYTVLGTPPLREAYDASLPAFEAPDADFSATDAVLSSRRRRKAGRDQSRPLISGRLSRLGPYALAIVLSAGSLTAGVWSGSTALMALGAGAALAIVVVATRHKIAMKLGDVATGTGSNAPVSEVRERARRLSHRTEPREADDRPTAPQRGIRADELRESTASMVGRWRNAAIAAATPAPAKSELGPDSTLVDIFRSEHEVEAAAEPLSAVLEVLRGSRG